MSWYPGAVKLELQPESDDQPAIRPTQFIVHSVVAPWTPERLYEYWKSTNLESHFGLGYDGSLGQFIGTQTRADANYQANRRADGTGAISLESASNLQHTDPWTNEQINTLVKVMDWAATEHGIPRRICGSWTDPGFGYHRLFPEWSSGGTACPGDARVEQFRKIVMPRLIAGDVEDTVALTDAEIEKIAAAVARTAPKAVWDHGISNRFRPDAAGQPKLIPARYYMEWSDQHFDATMTALAGLESAALTDAQVQAIATKVAAAPGLADAIAAKVAELIAERMAE